MPTTAPTPPSALSAHLASLDYPALIAAAFPGLALTLTNTTSTDPAALAQGGMNVHVPLDLSDGSTWLLRVNKGGV
jgi:hypothetical protein